MMQAVKDFAKHQPEFSDAARVQAEGLGDKGHKIQDPVSKLGLSFSPLTSIFYITLIFPYADGEVKALLHAAHEVIKDPNSEAPKKKLAKNAGDARASVVAASDAIRSAPPPVFAVVPEVCD
jgi:hypothetical protein